MAFKSPCQQASCSIPLTDQTQSDCLPERIRDCHGRTAQKASILKQHSFFLLRLKTKKHAFSFSPTAFKCFVAGPLKRAARFIQFGFNSFHVWYFLFSIFQVIKLIKFLKPGLSNLIWLCTHCPQHLTKAF